MGSEPGEHFYRFVSLAGERANHLRDVLLEHRLFQPSPASFNDPFDCKVTLSFDSSEADWRGRFQRLARTMRPGATDVEVGAQAESLMAEKKKQGSEFEKGVVRGLQDDVNAAGVVCFSSDVTTPLLWAHYANGHRGACLRFAAHSGVFRAAQEVKYRKRRKLFKATEVQDHNKIEYMEATILTKADDWRYEREWRLFQPGEAGRFAPFQPSELTGLILGFAISPEDVARIRSWLAQRSTPLSLFVARQRNPSSFELEMVDAS